MKTPKTMWFKVIVGRLYCFDHVAQAVAKGQLAESHAQELVPAGKTAEAFLNVEVIDALMKNLGMNQRLIN
jgi:hypothetical protein